MERQIWIDQAFVGSPFRVRELRDEGIRTLATFAVREAAEEHARGLLGRADPLATLASGEPFGPRAAAPDG